MLKTVLASMARRDRSRRQFRRSWTAAILLADVKTIRAGAAHSRHHACHRPPPAKEFAVLDLGADDVLSVPFDDRELLARVRTPAS